MLSNPSDTQYADIAIFGEKSRTCCATSFHIYAQPYDQDTHQVEAVISLYDVFAFTSTRNGHTCFILIMIGPTKGFGFTHSTLLSQYNHKFTSTDK